MKNTIIALILFELTLFYSLSVAQNGTEMLDYAIKQYSRLVKTVKDGVEYPTYGDPLSETWDSTEPQDKVIFEQSMYPGVLWYLFLYTDNQEWMRHAAAATDGLYRDRFLNTSHDIGFIFINAFNNGYTFTRNDTYRNAIADAASTLASRFNPIVGCTRSWASSVADEFIVIADNMMNLELLFRGWQITGNQKYYDMAISHTNRTIKEHIRSDGSSFQVVEFNSTTGEVIRKRTQQGWANWSCWSRGQAWLLNGLTTTYRYTRLNYILEAAEKVSQYYISHLPDDYVPYFDFSVENITLDYIPKDTSSAAIASAGLLELHQLTNKTEYWDAASKIVGSLFKNYRANVKPEYKLPALLINGTHWYKNANYDKAMSFGDYYFAKTFQYFM